MRFRKSKVQKGKKFYEKVLRRVFGTDLTLQKIIIIDVGVEFFAFKNDNDKSIILHLKLHEVFEPSNY